MLLPTLLLLLPAIDDEDGFRSAVVPLGDVNGDEIPDFAVAHRPRCFGMSAAASTVWPQVDHQPAVWVLSGEDGKVLRLLKGPSGFGSNLASVGDLDGDGVAELAIGDGGRSGVRIYSPVTGAVVHHLEAPLVPNFGAAFDGGVQLVGSATPDLVVGSDGCVFVVDGDSGRPVEAIVVGKGCVVQRLPVDRWSAPRVEGLTPAPGFVIDTSSYVKAPFGARVGVLDDLDGDRLGEVLVAGPADPACAAIGDEAKPMTFYTTRVLFSSDQREPLALRSGAWCVASGEDLDADGAADLLTTTVNYRTRAWSLAKREMLWEETYDGGYLIGEGTSLALTSDHDGDGVRDVLFAANETFFDADDGWVSVLSGRSGEDLKFWQVSFPDLGSPPGGLHGGVDATPIGDLDGDGLEEIAIQLQMAQQVQVRSGKDLSLLWRRSFSELESAR